MTESPGKRLRASLDKRSRGSARATAPQDRRNDYDVTNTIQVSDPAAVRREVSELFTSIYPDVSFDRLWLVFYDFERLFNGRLPGYLGCDTTYHDMQHSLDMTLTMARLIVGYEKVADAKLGPERAEMGLVTSLFHDAGYIRHIERDRNYRNGAEFTQYHVSRSADFLRRYLPHIGMEAWVPIASQIVHFTGYEVSLDDIELEDPRDSYCGHLLGTADLVTQMADRCYLEKCRDRLFNEFVIGGLAIDEAGPGESQVNYRSGEELLLKTPAFYAAAVEERLDKAFGKAYRYLEVLFDGENPYMEAVAHNQKYLRKVIDSKDFTLLRRSPPVFVGEKNSLRTVRAMVREQLRHSPAADNDPVAEDGRLAVKNLLA